MIVFVQPPYRGGNRQKIQEKIVKDKIKLPAFLSSEAHSLLKGVIKLYICMFHVCDCDFATY